MERATAVCGAQQTMTSVISRSPLLSQVE